MASQKYHGIWNPFQLIWSAKESIDDFNATTQTVRINVVQDRNTITPKSMIAPCGVIKVNWNAAIDKSREMMGVGVTIRDHDGNVLATMCSSKPYIVNPTATEASATWKSIELNRDLGILNIMLEGDVMEI